MKPYVRSHIAAIVCVALLASTVPANARTEKIVLPFSQIDQQGNEVTGPADITVERINPLRFDNARLATTTTLDPVPDITTALAGVFSPGAGTPGTPSGIVAQRAAVNTDVARLLQEYSGLVESASKVDEKLDRDARFIVSAINAVDETLKSKIGTIANPLDPKTTVDVDSPTASIALIKKALVDVKFGSDPNSNAYDWPAAKIDQLKANIFVLKQTFSATKSGATEMAAEIKTLDALSSQLDLTLGPTSVLKKDYDAKTTALQLWRPIFQGAQTLDRFSVSTTVACHNSLQSAHTTVVLKATDRLDPSKLTEVSKTITTVNCYSRLSLTHGAMYTQVRDEKFVVAAAPQPSASPAANVQTVQRSADHPNRVLGEGAIVHYRFFGDADGTALHLSFGVPDQTQSFAGLTVSFGRTLFLTAGPVRSQTTSLTNGFAVGQTVPTGTTLTTTTGSMTRMGYGISIPLSSSLAGGKTQTADKSKDNTPAAQPVPTAKKPTAPAAAPTPASGH